MEWSPLILSGLRLRKKSCDSDPRRHPIFCPEPGDNVQSGQASKHKP